MPLKRVHSLDRKHLGLTYSFNLFISGIFVINTLKFKEVAQKKLNCINKMKSYDYNKYNKPKSKVATAQYKPRF